MTLEEIMQTAEYKEIDKKLVFNGMLLFLVTMLLFISFVFVKVLFVLDLFVEIVLIVNVIRYWYKETKYIKDNIDNDSKMK